MRRKDFEIDLVVTFVLFSVIILWAWYKLNC